MGWQGKGLGRMFTVHAKDDTAKALYERCDFIPSPTDPYHLFRLLKDIRATLKSGAPHSGP
jgi:hypothetical protein